LIQMKTHLISLLHGKEEEESNSKTKKKTLEKCLRP
jgi:hypothetical protein